MNFDRCLTNLDRCSACGEGAIKERRGSFEFKHNGRVLVIEESRMVCDACGNISYRGPQVSAHEFAVASAIRRAEGLLSPEELKNIRVKYRLKQTDMEQMLSTGPKTWTRWERGKVIHSKVTDQLIRQMAMRPDLVRELMIGSGVDNSESLKVIDDFVEDAKRIASRMFTEKLGERPSEEMRIFAERVAETAFDTMRDAQRIAVSRSEAA